MEFIDLQSFALAPPVQCCGQHQGTWFDLMTSGVQEAIQNMFHLDN
jgi:hypothetical protein